MRAFLLGLVLLNVVFLLWQMLSDEAPIQIPKTAPGVKLLALVSEAKDIEPVADEPSDTKAEPVAVASKGTEKKPVSPIIEEPPTLTSAPAPKPKPVKPIVKVAESVCYSLSGFVQKKAADDASKVLLARNYKVKATVVYPQKSKFLVYLPSLGSLTNAKKITADLKQKNIRDFQILALRGKDNGISLGVFRNPEIAENRVKQITALGYAPILQPISGKPLNYKLLLNRKDKQPLTATEQGFIKKSFKNTQLKQKKCTS